MTDKNLHEKQKFIILRAKGYSLAKISKELNKCRQTLANWHNELQEEIANAKAIELESLFEECRVSKEHRIKNLSDLMKKINDELAKRNFSDIATDRLIEIKAKLNNQLRSEYLQPQIKSEKQMQKAKNSRQLFE